MNPYYFIKSLDRVIQEQHHTLSLLIHHLQLSYSCTWILLHCGQGSGFQGVWREAFSCGVVAMFISVEAGGMKYRRTGSL